ncbi:MAG TPA: RNA-binding transcriptional accessory protein, partial [Alcanivorax sp.]|nr:RNA-binding transcriptional accessory protein [Alcanivorax sp.]HBP67979.1 RNA-binding transcriptional accessory protein [Alcanivorax sp.]HBP91045.1 RNA-binding transcriptional accessory protein [Alcanivorax sp.]
SVTNVTNFGAFVDVGVHQDGLVHVSALADKFVEDPHDVVKPGDIVKVKVMEVDLPRKRISLTMRLDERHQDQPKSADAPAGRPRGRGGKPKGGGRGQSGGGQKPAAQGALGAAFAKAFEDKNKRG